MATQPRIEIRQHDPTLAERHESGHPKPVAHGTFRSLGLGLITGASDDDPAAIGTYAAAGASLGPSFLWAAPGTLVRHATAGMTLDTYTQAMNEPKRAANAQVVGQLLPVHEKLAASA